MTPQPARAVQAFQALGDVQRLAIVELLRERPRPVGELAALLPVSRPAVSRHLRVLKQAGLVTDAAIGTRRVYTLEQTRVCALVAYLDAVWQDALGRFVLVADNLNVARRDER